MTAKTKNNTILEISLNKFPVVGIGASAGGLEAFKRLIKAIPEKSGMAYVLVQHLDPNHESLLPEILQKVTRIPVLEITDEILVKPNHIYVIPSNKMMVSTDGILQLTPRPDKNTAGRNMPIDLFFSSLAEVHQNHAIGVVLSGTATDGTKGLKAIKANGGITFAQDEESAEYEGMPNNAVDAGVVDFVLPPEEIPQKLLEVTSIIKSNGSDEKILFQHDTEVYRQILSLLRIRKGTDFTYYKQTTIHRRILRRMAINKNESPSEYLKYLRESKQEQDALYQDMLIPVTDFFRDPIVFKKLSTTIFPQLLKSKSTGQSIRIWVAGCSTGEEAYSVAICLKEFLGDSGSLSPSMPPGERIQIFATDLSEPAIAKARLGIYSKLALESVSAIRLQKFFTKNNGNYQVNKWIRDMCVFAHHDFLKDPPFGKIDFICCRNVLIYMEPYLQKKALTTFHYSLKSKGFLLLGKSETTNSVPELFTHYGKTEKLFVRNDAAAKVMLVKSNKSEQAINQVEMGSIRENHRTDFQKTADEIILGKYTPAGVVVNEQMEIVHFRGKTASYLEQAAGKPSHNLVAMAKQGLAFELRNTLHKVKKEKGPIIKENIQIIDNGNHRTVTIEILPLPNTIEPYYLVLFHETLNLNQNRSNIESSSKSKRDEKDKRIIQLERELEQVREDMRSITEDQEAANEELQSANEELMSSSEELQSLNEELETSKEELQSTNEELTVVNQEMISLFDQVAAARNYAEAIVENIPEPLLVLDKNLRIKTANQSFYNLFRVNEKETEGRLIYDIGNKQWEIPELRVFLEKILPEKSIFFGFEVSHNFQKIGSRIMLLNAREIHKETGGEKLILLAIQDVTFERTATKKIVENEQRFNLMLMQSPFGFCLLKGKDMVISLANDSIKKIWGKGLDVEGKPLLEVLPEIKNQQFPELLNNVFTSGIPFYGADLLSVINRNGTLEDIYTNFVYQPFREPDETITGVVIIAIEVTPGVVAKKRLEESEKYFHFIADAMPQKVWTADPNGSLNYFNRCWFEYTGLSFKELKDWGWLKVIHPDDLANTKNTWQHSLDTGDHFEIEHRFINTAGIYKWHLTRGLAQKNENGKIKIWIGTNTEIQEQQEYKQELEKAVEKRTSQLQDANKAIEERFEELRKMNQELEAFAFVSSHDLQEPLRKIQTFSAHILEKENDNLSDTGKDYLARMLNSTKRMRSLINDLLAFSRVNSAERNFEITDLNEIIEEVKTEYKDTMDEKNATIETGELCPVFVIKFQFHQVIQNLIGNSLKFSKPGKPPRIFIKSRIVNADKLNIATLMPGKDYCHLSVQDNGIGFDPQYSEKIFEVFQKLHSKDEYAGTGIGLAIVKKIVDIHNGFVKANGKLNEGAVFDVFIPVKQ